jgi:thiaminase/transcriptional activator TenA
MRFSEQLRQEADPIFEAIFSHSFVQGIAKGEVPKEALIHYVKQDYEYLNAFMKVYGIAISKAESREDMAMYNEQISFVLHSEVHPHLNFCEVAGVNYEDLQGESLAPTADHYISHMLSVAYRGTPGEILAVLLPCPWTYWEIGKKITDDVQPNESHPFYEWIRFYNDDVCASVTKQFCNRLDRWALTAGEHEKQKMKEAFLTSCRLEYAFWDMAYTEEKWQPEKA